MGCTGTQGGFMTDSGLQKLAFTVLVALILYVSVFGGGA